MQKRHLNIVLSQKLEWESKIGDRQITETQNNLGLFLSPIMNPCHHLAKMAIVSFTRIGLL